MPSENRIVVLGHAGKDAESGTTTGGTDTCKFSLATANLRRDPATGKMTNREADGTTYIPSQWHNIVVFGKDARYCADIRKGDLVQATGKLVTRPYQKRDGTPGLAVEVIAFQVLRVVPFPRANGHTPEEGSYHGDVQDTRPMDFDSFDVGDLGPPLDMEDTATPGD